MDIKTLALLFRDVRHPRRLDALRWARETNATSININSRHLEHYGGLAINEMYGTVLSAHPIVVFLAKEERGHQNPRSSVSRCTASPSTI